MVTTDAAPVAVLGAGRMGAAFVEVLADAGHPIRVWNRTPARALALERAGVMAVDTVPATVVGCRVVVSALAHDAAVTEALTGLRLAPGGVLVEASTISPRTLSDLARTISGAVVGAAVSGTPSVVRSGRAGVLIAGPRPAKELVVHVLGELAADVVDLGPDPAAAKLAKLGLNAILAGTTELLAETIVLMESEGLSREAFAPALASSVLASPFIGYKMDAAQRRDYAATFSTRGLAKDVDLVLAEAGHGGVALPLLSQTRELLLDALSRDLGDQDLLSLLPRLQAANRLSPDIPVPPAKR